MARAPVEQIPLSSMLRPTATPVDTYERPAESSLRGLAGSLGVLNSGIQTLLETRDKKAEEDAELKGRAAFLKDSSGEIARSITEGRTPAQFSPFYVRGFKNAQGAAAGDSLRTKWQDAWDNWEGKDSEDEAAFDSFFGEFLKNNLGSDDPDVLRGVLPAVEALQQNARTQYIQYRHDQTVNGSLTAHGAVISGTVQNGLDDGLVSDKGADYPAIFENVNRVVAENLAKGDPGGNAVDTFIDVMSAKVLESKDPKLLDWFDQKVPGKDYTYGQTKHGLEVRNATVGSLEALARQQAAGMTAAEKQAMEKAKDEAQSAIIDGILKNPEAPFDQKMLDQAKKNGDPLIEVHARQWRSDLLKGASDPAKLASWYDDVAAGRVRPQQALQQGLANQVFGTADDIRAAASFVQSFQTSEDTITKTLGGQVARQVLETIRTRTVAKDPITMNPIAGTSDEGFEATSDFRQLVTRWIINNPNATLPEIEEQVTKFGKMITDRFALPEGGDTLTDAYQYNRDEDLPFGNPYSEPAAGQEATPSKQGAELQATPEDEEQARRRGMGVEEYLQQKQQEGSDAAAAKPISYNPNDNDLGEGDVPHSALTREQAEQFIDQAFDASIAKDITADEQAGNLLGFIRQHEANGNYNAVWGNPGATRDLSKYTLDEVLGHQQDARRRGIPSTAIGAYGFIYKTLRGLKSEMGLSGSEPFTPDLQDKMGKTLLNRRGLQAYRAGRISKKQFALSLSQEFAALPNPNTGRSFYEGDGLNKSQTTTQAVYKALGFGNPEALAYQPTSYSKGSTADMLASYGETVSPGFQKVAGLRWNGRKLSDVKGLTIHHTGGRGSPDDIVKVLNKRGFGAQFIMDRDGTIYQTVPDGGRVAHMKRAQNGSGLSNDNSMGIEIIANDDNDLTPAQVASAVKWIEMMRQKYPGIGENVFGHGQLNAHKQATEGMAVVNAWRRSLGQS